MTIPLVVPLDVPLDGVEHGDHAFGFLEPLIGLGTFVLVAALLVATILFLRRRGWVPPVSLPAWPGRAAASPELAARKVLAERFARGDISTEDFLERASVLNWTPGSENYPPRRVGGS